MAEVAEKYESLLAEQSAADKRDHEASMALFRDSADTDLNETKERYEALLAEKDSLSAEFERAKDEAYAEKDELRRELASREQSSATDGAEATKKYETLLAEKTAADEAHEAALSDLKQSLKSEREQALAELQAQNSALPTQRHYDDSWKAPRSSIPMLLSKWSKLMRMPSRSSWSVCRTARQTLCSNCKRSSMPSKQSSRP